MDIDFFKTVNDTYGHDAGDEVLREFARRIAANVRGIDLACRYGGEEFVVVMPDTDIAYAYAVAERLRKSIETTPIEDQPRARQALHHHQHRHRRIRGRQRQRRRPFCTAPIRRSIAPRRRAATAWWRTRREAGRFCCSSA